MSYCHEFFLTIMFFVYKAYAHFKHGETKRNLMPFRLGFLKLALFFQVHYTFSVLSSYNYSRYIKQITSDSDIVK